MGYPRSGTLFGSVVEDEEDTNEALSRINVMVIQNLTIDKKERSSNSQVETGVPTLLKEENDDEKPKPHKSVRFG